MRIRVVATFILMLIGFEALQAQDPFKPGYLITNDADTLFGLIYFPGWSNLENGIQYKKDVTSLAEQYKPQSVQSFSVEGEQYISRLVNIDLTPLQLSRSHSSSEILTEFTSRKVFLKLLIKGDDVSLFYYFGTRDNFYVRTDARFLQLISHTTLRRINGNLIPGEENKNLFKEQLKNISSCSNANTQSLTYTRSSISDFIRKCNTTYGDGKKYAESPSVWKMNHKIYSGINYSRIKISDFSNTVTSSPKIGFRIGFVSEFLNTEKNPLLTYRIGGGLSHYRSELNENVFLFGEQFKSLTSELTYLDINPGVKFSFIQNKLSPYITFGVNASILLANTSKVILESTTASNTEDEVLETNKFILGYNAGIGVSFTRIDLSFNSRLFKHKDRFFNSATGVIQKRDRVLSFDITASYKL